MKNLFTLLLVLNVLSVFGGNSTKLTAVSGPTPVAGDRYQTVIQVCFDQQLNNGGTESFTITVEGTTIFSYTPNTITNPYKAKANTSSCTPCTMNGCSDRTGNAITSLSGSVITFTSIGGLPIIPHYESACASTANTFCFNMTIVTNSFPRSITLGGDVEMATPKACQTSCGTPNYYTQTPYTSPDSKLSYTDPALGVELITFDGEVSENGNNLWWITTNEINNSHFIVEKSEDGVSWGLLEFIPSYGPGTYRIKDRRIKSVINYYRLIQIDTDGVEVYYETIAIDNSEQRFILIKYYSLEGKEVDEYNRKGLIIEYYEDGTILKVIYPQ